MIKFNCTHCGAKVKAPSTYIGKEAKCPSCKEKNIIPGKEDPEKYEIQEVKPDYNNIFCQHCGKEMMREAVCCPKCGCANELNKRNIQQPLPQQVLLYQQQQKVSGGNIAAVYVMSILFPIGGIIGGIYLMCKGETAHGIANLLLSIFVGIPFGMGLMAGMGLLAA